MMLNRIKQLLTITILGFTNTSCIDFFHPRLNGESDNKYVIDGTINDRDSLQVITISTTSTVSKPNFNPLSYCKVKVIDDIGNTFIFEENVKERGKYESKIDNKFLKPGISYQVQVETASGIEIVSDFDKMPECPDVDTIYYIRKDIQTSDPLSPRQGIQFYIDIDKQNTNCEFFRWRLTETYEHHAMYPQMIGETPNYSMFKCWTTLEIKDIFVLSTKNISQETFHLQPLNFVDNRSQRLTFCYSLLVDQYAVSEATYKFWESLKSNSSEQGGLYSTQPIIVKGNLRSTTNPDVEVLGFFNASSIKSKRIFVKNVENLKIHAPDCNPQVPDKFTRFNYFINIEGTTYGLSDACVECDYVSGTTVRPPYWPN